MSDVILELLLNDEELEIDLNEGVIDPYLQLEDIEVIEAPRTVDTEMSDTSESPVQNKVIKTYVDTAITTVVADKHYTHTQIVASNLWNVTHNLAKYPTVAIIDSGGSIVIGEIEYLTANTLQIRFNAIFSGKAYCN